VDSGRRGKVRDGASTFFIDIGMLSLRE